MLLLHDDGAADLGALDVDVFLVDAAGLLGEAAFFSLVFLVERAGVLEREGVLALLGVFALDEGVFARLGDAADAREGVFALDGVFDLDGLSETAISSDAR